MSKALLRRCERVTSGYLIAWDCGGDSLLWCATLEALKRQVPIAGRKFLEDATGKYWWIGSAYMRRIAILFANFDDALDLASNAPRDEDRFPSVEVVRAFGALGLLPTAPPQLVEAVVHWWKHHEAGNDLRLHRLHSAYVVAKEWASTRQAG